MKGDATVRLDLTSTDLGVIVTVNEARRSKGLPPLTIAECRARHEATQGYARHRERSAAGSRYRQ